LIDGVYVVLGSLRDSGTPTKEEYEALEQRASEVSISLIDVPRR
jgi:hypothetical protein